VIAGQPITADSSIPRCSNIIPAGFACAHTLPAASATCRLSSIAVALALHNPFAALFLLLSDWCLVSIFDYRIPRTAAAAAAAGASAQQQVGATGHSSFTRLPCQLHSWLGGRRRSRFTRLQSQVSLYHTCCPSCKQVAIPPPSRPARQQLTAVTATHMEMPATHQHAVSFTRNSSMHCCSTTKYGLTHAGCCKS